MADTAAPTPVKTPKKKTTASKPKKLASHPPYLEMIQKAIAALKERGGSSRQALLKYIMANYKVGENSTAVNARVKTALKNGVKNGALKQSKGTGAAGSFRLGEVKKADKPKKVKAVTKPKKTVKSPKKVKKPTAAKKPKTVAKKAAKSPKKAKAAAKPKKVKTPKKAKTTATKPKKAKTPKKKTAAKPKKA